MEVNRMKHEDERPRHVTAIFVNTKEGLAAMRRLEARIENCPA